MRVCSSVVVLQHRIRIREKRRQRSSLLLLLSIWPQDDLKKRTNRRTNTWRNGCFGKMNDHLVLNTPNHQPPQMDVLPKTFLWIILGYIATFKYVPPPAATTFAFPSVWFCLCCSYIRKPVICIIPPSHKTLGLVAYSYKPTTGGQRYWNGVGNLGLKNFACFDWLTKLFVLEAQVRSIRC